MSSITELIEFDGLMLPSRPQSPSSCFVTEDTSPFLPDLLHHSIPMTPHYNGLAMPLAVVKQNMTAREMNAFEFMHYLDIISPLSPFLNNNSQNFDTFQSTDSKSIALDGTSTPGQQQEGLWHSAFKLTLAMLASRN